MEIIERYSLAVKFVAAVGCGLMAGVFFAFSVFVMSALASLKTEAGIAAMQAINGKVLHPLFMLIFLGTALLCLVLCVAHFSNRGHSGALWMFVGCVLYVVGTFGVTVAFNVPLNDALAKVTPTSADAARVWADYLATWTLWNHVRMLCALAAMVAFIASLCARASQ